MRIPYISLPSGGRARAGRLRFLWLTSATAAASAMAVITAITVTAVTAAYGYVGGPYYGLGYGGGYFYGGYGYDPFGWYGDYYYPGVGIYVYDSHRNRHVWNDSQRRYWTNRQSQLAQSLPA